MKLIEKIQTLFKKRINPYLEFVRLFRIKKNIRKSDKNEIVALVEVTTTNEYFYLKPVLEKLKKDGAFLIFTGNENILPPLRDLLNKNEILKDCQSIHLKWSKYVNAPMYINATLSYDIKVPPSSKVSINFPHTIVSKTKHDVFSPAIEKITDTLITGEIYKQDQLLFLKENNIVKQPRIHEVGCPRSDVFFENKNIDKNQFLKDRGLDPNLPVVFYTPTWNPNTSIFTWREKILQIPERLKVNLIVKVHPGAYLDPNHKKGSGGIDWEKFFKAEELQKRRIWNAMNMDSVDITKISDIGLTDISTMWVEYYLLKKPIIFLDIPEFFKDHQMNSLGEFRNNFGYLVKDVSELDLTINKILNKEYGPKSVGSEIDQKLLYNRGSATEKAVNVIKSLNKSEIISKNNKLI